MHQFQLLATENIVKRTLLGIILVQGPYETSNRLFLRNRKPHESLLVPGRKSSAPRRTPLTLSIPRIVIIRPVLRFTTANWAHELPQSQTATR